MAKKIHPCSSMVGFESFLTANRIQEWENFYLDYRTANRMLEKYARQKEYMEMKITSGNDPPYRRESLASALHITVSDQPTTYTWSSHLPPEDPLADLNREFFNFLEDQFKKTCKFYKEQEAMFVYNVNLMAQDIYKIDVHKVTSVGSELQVRAKELYRGLSLMRKFCDLNRMAYAKILKKHRKNSGIENMKDIIQAKIDRSVIFNPPLLEEMGRKIEHMYATNFTHGDVKQSNKELRGQKEKHNGDWASFKVGFSVGLSFCCAVIVIICLSFTPALEDQPFFYLVFPLYRGLGLILTLIWMWGGDVYLCERLHINQANILKVDHRSYLRAVDVLYLAGSLTVIYLLFAVAYFGLEAFPHVKVALGLGWIQNEYLNLVMLACVIFSFVCPYPILYPTTRYYILNALKRIVLAPFCEVKFIDFFLGDQLCSLVRVLDDISYSLCFFGSGSFLTKSTMCSVFSDRAKYVVAFLPYHWRMWQSFRRWRDGNHEKGHLYNALKYFLSILVTFFSLLTPIYPVWALPLWLFFAIIATFYSYAWDILKDWGLLEKGPGFPLRRRTRLSNKRWYYVFAVLNFFMRCAWVSTVSPDFFERLHIRKDFLLAALSFIEIIRRGIWNFFRLENEHLNNCGKFRAFNMLVVPHHEPPPPEKRESSKVKLAEMEEHKALLDQAIERRKSSPAPGELRTPRNSTSEISGVELVNCTKGPYEETKLLHQTHHKSAPDLSRLASPAELLRQNAMKASTPVRTPTSPPPKTPQRAATPPRASSPPYPPGGEPLLAPPPLTKTTPFTVKVPHPPSQVPPPSLPRRRLKEF